MESLLIGHILGGRYRVDEVLGRGGMSVVYRATDQRLGRPVALKIVAFPPDMDATDRAELRERLRREASSAACIPSHPNVVQIFDHGRDDALDLDFLTMELLRGEDLKQRLRAGRIGRAEALQILAGAARGLAAGHRSGIVHRDVKPANIFLSRDGDALQVKVLDFGIAKALEPTPNDDLTRFDRIPHSPAYASPEQLGAGGKITAASDVYQLGLIAHELLTGERPFSENDRRRLAEGEELRVRRDDGWLAVDAVTRGVVERALQARPERRFASAGDFLRALEGAPADDEATVLFTPVADADQGTVAIPLASGAAAHGLAPAPASATPLPRRSLGKRRRRQRRSYALYAAAAAGTALLVWTALGGGRGALGPSDRAEANGNTSIEEAITQGVIRNLDELHAEFRPLIREAYERLREQAQRVD